MVTIHQLHIRNNNLELDFELPELDYQTNIYIKGLLVYDMDMKPVYTEEFENTKHLFRIIPETSILTDIHSQLLFVKIYFDGLWGANTPCKEDVEYETFCTFDEMNSFRSIIHKVKDEEGSCKLDLNLLNNLFRLKALLYSIAVRDFKCAVFIYKKFFKNLKKCLTDFKPCSCK